MGEGVKKSPKLLDVIHGRPLKESFDELPKLHNRSAMTFLRLLELRYLNGFLYNIIEIIFSTN